MPLEPFVNESLFSALRAAFPSELSALAIDTANGTRYTWRDIDVATAQIANLLDALALPAGSRVAVQVDKSVEAMLLYLATLRAGLVFVPLNIAYQSAEIAYFIENAEPAVVVCASRNAGWVNDVAREAGVAHLFTLDDNQTGSLLERSAAMPAAHEAVARRGTDLASIIYTSGTTGRSKGAMLSHGNLLSNALVLKDYWGWRPGDVLIHALPIFHVHGLFVALHGALISGSRMIWFDKFEPESVLLRMPEASVFMGVPTLYTRLLADPGLDRDAVCNMRLFLAGSAPLQVETFHAWSARTGHEIVERYGMSETLMLSSNPYHHAAGRRRAGTVGHALPGVQLRVAQDGRPSAVNEIGGIEVKGQSVFSGYWRMPEKTREEFTEDGFFKTGDVGRIDGAGYLSIVGRSKDLIISGGYNVYPAEIEVCLDELPEVVESAVVGLPHPDFGEVGVAVVVMRAGAQLQEADILSRLKTRLANFKVPKRCFEVDALPRNVMGKVQKNLLRERFRPLFLQSPAETQSVE